MEKHVWEISGRNSSIHFSVKYLRIGTISGKFGRISGTVTAGDLFKDPEVAVSIDANSVETLDARRNIELRSGPCLAVEEYPWIAFNSIGGCIQRSGKVWELTGDLSVKEITSAMTLVISSSYINEEKKRPTALFHLFGKISRRDFGLDCIEREDIDDEVSLDLRIYMIRKD